VLDALLEGVRSRESGILVLRGEPGVGKTALLEYAVRAASSFHVARVVGVESEMEFPFAILQQLCAPLLDRLGRLPEPQSDALRVAFGLSAGPTPDRFLVGLAVLSLLCEVGEHAPLPCVIDDAQWLDRTSAQVLAFVARRLLADPVGLVFSVREPNEDLVGLPELVVNGLRDADARALLDSLPRVPLDRGVYGRVVAEAHGNPLALLEWTRVITPMAPASGLTSARSLPLSSRLEQGFRQ
jgi:hypothetical protein